MLVAIGILVLGLAAGGVGGLLGLGGGIFVVPGLTLLFGVPMKNAIAASALCVIATSLGASTIYVRDGLANVRLGLLLQVSTAVGAVAGGLAAVAVDPQWLSGLFAVVACYVALAMRRGPVVEPAGEGSGEYQGDYYDQALGCEVRYQPHHVRAGMTGSIVAGGLSGLLGVGGGVVQVPVMSRVMGVPLRAAIATSSFMMGITAAAGALGYYANGLVRPEVAVPAVLGVFVGSRVASSLGSRARHGLLQSAFQVLLALVALQMAAKAIWP